MRMCGPQTSVFFQSPTNRLKWSLWSDLLWKTINYTQGKNKCVRVFHWKVNFNSNKNFRTPKFAHINFWWFCVWVGPLACNQLIKDNTVHSSFRKNPWAINLIDRQKSRQTQLKKATIGGKRLIFLVGPSWQPHHLTI